MSSNIEDTIYNILEFDFLNIQPENGFENSIKSVYRGQKLFSQITTGFPSICIEYLGDVLKSEGMSENNVLMTSTIQIFVYISENTEDEYRERRKSLERDLDKIFFRSNTIISTYHCHLNNAGTETEYRIMKYDPEYIPFQNGYGQIGFEIQLDYRKNAGTIDSSTFSITSIPSADLKFTLTSYSAFLQSEILSISGSAISGINTWGTIGGSLSSQTDLQSELDSRSLSSHTHSQYFLNSLTGTLTSAPVNLNPYTLTSDFISATGYLNGAITGINLSNYSTTGHSHSSFTSLSANILYAPIVVPTGSSGDLPFSIRRGDGVTGLEGFYSLGSGMGVMCNYTLSNAFLSTGLETRKLMLDNDMWNNDTTIYESSNNGMVFTTNSLDRLLITSAGNVGIGTNNPSAYVTINQPNSLTASSDIFCLSSSFFGNAVKVDKDGYFFIYRGYPTVNGSCIRISSDGSGGNIVDNSGLLTISSAAGYPKSAGLSLHAGDRIVKLTLDTNPNEFVMTPTQLSISANLSVTGNITVNGNSTYTGSATSGQTLTIVNGLITNVS